MPKPLSKRQGKRAYNLRPTEITLKGHAFRVNDISTEGIGLIVEENGPAFKIGERLDVIPIPLESGTVNVQGVVSHISVTAAARICGIHFIFSGAEYDAVIRFKKERMLTLSTREKK